jgi:hypothetical protein
MATNTKNRSGDTVHLEDVVEVGSRVSWGAIVAGAVMALAVGFVLSLLGSAVGLSFVDNADRDTLTTGAAIWAAATTLISLFVGGWITSQCVVGETKTESVVHGIIMWGVVLAMLLYLTASGIGAGFSSMLQVANVTANASKNASSDDIMARMRAAGMSEEDVTNFQQKFQNAANDPETRQQMKDTATQATWWTFGGTVASMIAAIGGAVVGAGPTFRLLPLHVTHRSTESRPAAG